MHCRGQLRLVAPERGRARARAVQPSQVPDFGITYNIQVGQAFGFNFGYGIVRQICAIGISLV